jgi:hypothetical protein
MYTINVLHGGTYAHASSQRQRDRDRGEVSPGHTNSSLLCIRVHKYGFTVYKFMGVKIHAFGHSGAQIHVLVQLGTGI